jgi:uncharacterized protein YjbI with pentapeptide repeats
VEISVPFEIPQTAQTKEKPMTNYWTVLATASLATLLSLVAQALVARADIFQWEYINPANPAQGKQPSTTLAPDGAGANAAPGVDLSSRNLAMAYLIGADLSSQPVYEEGFFLYYITTDLSAVNLSQADLTNASFHAATLTDANLTGAEVRGANFSRSFYYGWGSGITAAQLYSTASYQAHDLTGIKLSYNNLAGVNLVGQNLTGAILSYATLIGADFTDAEVRGAVFGSALFNPDSSLTLTQLYSTASYEAHDLSGIALQSHNLAGANFAMQNLINAIFDSSEMNDANFSQANLSNARLYDVTLTGANLTGAEVRGAAFSGHYYGPPGGLSLSQLYSTASYQAHDLTGIQLFRNDLTGGDFVDQNLTNADLQGASLVNADFRRANLSGAQFAAFYDTEGVWANLTGANLSHANLTNAIVYSTYTTLTGVNLTSADARGAVELDTIPGSAFTANLIQSNGHIAGLNLTAGASLVIRDYDGNPAESPPTGPLPIVVEQHLAMDASGTLRLVFDADPWDSTISFAPGISVVLGGTLELTFAPGVDVATQSGRTIDLFDWTGVAPTGAFSVSSPYSWNLSNLYTTGEVTLAAVPSLPGDFDLDSDVDGIDFLAWQRGESPNPFSGTDLAAWEANYGIAAPLAEASAAVPEPGTFALALVVLGSGLCLRRRQFT